MVTMDSPDPLEGSQTRGTSATSSSTATTTSAKKKKNLNLGSFKSPFKFLGKTYCKGCRKKCSGEVLRVNDVYFHSNCFKCKGCSGSLSQGGFFTREKDYYCATCYQSNFGTMCHACNKFVEGEVVTALGKTYHQACFRCASCNKTFPTGERVTFTGKSCLCTSCAKSTSLTSPRPAAVSHEASLPVAASPVAPPRHDTSDPVQKVSTATQKGTTVVDSKKTTGAFSSTHSSTDRCAGCHEELKEGQALMALDKQFHVWCFKCKSCNALLHGEYMGKDGNPYCEKDYQALFGVKCTYCLRFISGKVLQAGENNHFHPTCARCTKCGEPFGDGEEMFLQGAAIWHPRCGPGPDDSGLVINGYESRDFDGASTVSEHMPYGSRASSPGASLRQPSGGHGYRGGWGGAFSPSLYHSSSTYSLRRPLEPGDRTGSSSHLNHFHLPASRRCSTSVGPSRYANNTSMDCIPAAAMTYRPISAPPKPGYTQTSSRSSTLPATPYKYNDYPGRSHTSFDMMSTHSYRTDYSTAAAATPMTEYKTYPLHLLFTSNYKMPPDVDRCNLEKHLSDVDFEMAFNMSRDEFYALPLWRRNDLKRRVRLF